MSKLSGFTDAELAAFEWSKKQKELDVSNKRKNETKHRTHRKHRKERRFRESSEDSFEELLKHRRGKRNNKDKIDKEHKSNKEELIKISKSKLSRSRSYDRSSSSTSISYGNSRSSSRESISKTRKYNYKRVKSSSESSLESRNSYADLPKDPFNPLNLAYKERRYTSRRNKSRYNDKVDKGKDKTTTGTSNYKDKIDKSNKEEEKWKHDLYESEGERASYEAEFRRKKIEQNIAKEYNKYKNEAKDKIDKSNKNNDKDYKEDNRKLITKRGWKSRAGGVYIPGEDEDEDLYYDYTSKRSRSYERPDPSYTLD